MANWISSKIKAAENLLQHIDQQAAESLGKPDRPQTPSDPLLFANDVSETDPTKQVIIEPKSINLPRKKPSSTQILPPKSPILSGNSSSVTSPSTSTVTRTDDADTDWTKILSSPSKPEKKETTAPRAGQRKISTAHKGREGKREKKEDSKVAAESGSGTGSDSESDSDSSYDSEEERRRIEERRKRREARLAEAAAKAIREKEEFVARLEGEKRSLERVLQEREKEQAQQATQLQVNTTEMIEAVEMEKKRHNSTRMEALFRVAKLEAVNAELSKLLATTQWNLELEANRVAQLRDQIELKELAQKEYRRKMSKIQTRSTLGDEMKPLRNFKLEIIDAEYSIIVDKVAKLQDKARSIEENIDMAKREMENRTETEIELENRLDQLSDRLIHKQSQVEALSSEKATLQLRIEMVSRLLDGTNPTEHLIDIEAGTTRGQSSPVRERTGVLQLHSVIHQLDSILSAGIPFLRRNLKALISVLVYFVGLHIWVMYILMSK